jgi:nucleoside-diphosphate-sugar epimerase
VRLPQVVGRTPNPHTLLNYLYARIARGERFVLWSRASRNVIDCDDVRAITVALLSTGAGGETLNVANARSYPILEIVETLERVTNGHAVYDVVDRGGAWPIDVSRMMPLAAECGVRFDGSYLERVLRKYYG